MKKFFMVAVMAAAALSANAQWWIGGGVDLNSSKASETVSGTTIDKEAVTNFTLAPEIGYNLNEKWAVAVALGYEFQHDGVLKYGSSKQTMNANKFSIAPFVRYTFYKNGNFAAFADGGVNFSTLHYNGTDEYMDNVKELGVGIRAGIKYNVTDKIALFAKLGKIGYDYEWTKWTSTRSTSFKNVEESNGEFQFNIVKSFELGIMFDL